MGDRRSVRFHGNATRLTEETAPNVKNRSHTLTAQVEVPEGGADGVLVAQGREVRRLVAVPARGQARLRLQRHDAREAEATVVALSEYGIAPADTPVDINRALRREGLLEVYTQDGMEYLDPWTSRAFAVADHQVAHVYVADDADLPKVRSLLESLGGVDEVLDRQAQARYGLDHERAGELVAVAEPRAWFTYYYWLDEARRPDFAKGVEIHRKPGYDPAELFFDPTDPLVKAKAGLNLVRKKVGLRYAMNVVPTDPRWVRGSHGRLPDSPEHGPVLLCSDPAAPSAVESTGRIAATDVADLLLQLQGIRKGA